MILTITVFKSGEDFDTIFGNFRSTERHWNKLSQKSRCSSEIQAHSLSPTI